MPFYLFTFRPQITEQQLFEDFITIFIPELEKLSRYSYTIEDDSTLQKHIHVLAESKAKDNSAFHQMFNKKIFKDFKSTLKFKQTNEHGFDDRKVKDEPEDFLKVLGYVNKESQVLRRGYKGFTEEEITNAHKYYHTIEKMNKETCKSDLTLLTMKNAHIHIKEYCIRNSLRPIDPYLKLRMVKDGYMFETIGSREKVRNIFSELDVYLNPEHAHPRQLEDNEGNNNPYIDSYYRDQEIIKKQKLEIEMLKSKLGAL